MGEEKEWVDFKAVKAAVSMQMVLDHYGIKGLKKSGDELRGPCPIHEAKDNARSFTANLGKNAFQCFSCGSRGNVLDLVAAMEECSVKDAALKLARWFKVGENEQPAPAKSAGCLQQLRQLTAELESHGAQIVFHAAQAEAKIAAIKEIVAAFDKGG